MKLERIRLGGIGALRRGGEGAPFVLLHGVGSAPESFLPLVGALGGAAVPVLWG